MSWSISFIGNPDNIVAAIEKESERLTGQSKVEYDAVKDMLSALVSKNYNNAGYTPMLRLSAAGHSYSFDGKPQYGNVSVSLESLNGRLV